MVKASSFKTWCTENISPQSWIRICLKCVETLRSKGFTLNEMENPSPDIELDDEFLKALNDALHEYYERKVDKDSLAIV